MAIPHIFNTQPAGNVPAQYLDDDFAYVLAQTAASVLLVQQQIQSGSLTWCGTAGGTPNAFTLTTPTPTGVTASTAYAAGQTWQFIAVGTSTGAVTVNVDGLGAVPVLKRTSAGLVPLASGDIVIGLYHSITYDGTEFVIDFIFSAGGSGGSGTFLTNQFFPWF